MPSIGNLARKLLKKAGGRKKPIHTQAFDPPLNAGDEDRPRKIIMASHLSDDGASNRDVEIRAVIPPSDFGAPNISLDIDKL